MEVMDGILSINKPKGYTSHDVVAIVRKKLNTKKVGHTGTLDPNATGVLPICVGRATKFASIISGSNKTYRANIILGKTTDTLDITGEVLSEKKVTSTKEEIEKAVRSFVGEIEQIPPMYSAIKVDGVRLYKLARKDIIIERQPRKVTITDIKIISFVSEVELIIEVACSSGTYIRTLCDDIGEKLGCGAVMGDLQRVESGGFTLTQCKEIDDFSAEDLMGIEQLFKDKVKLTVKPNGQKFLDNGNKLSINFIENKCELTQSEGKEYLVYSENNAKFYGIYKLEANDMLKPTFFVG